LRKSIIIEILQSKEIENNTDKFEPIIAAIQSQKKVEKFSVFFNNLLIFV